MNKIIYLILFTSLCSYSQSADKSSYNVKTPNVSDFIKYGNVNSMSNIGELKVDIPVVSLPVIGQNPIEVSLSYSGSGFRPSKRSGLVGYNWYLNVGGAITREINNVPDDQKGHPTYFESDTNYANGFIIGVTYKTHNPIDVFNFAPWVTYEQSWHKTRFLYGNSAQIQSHANDYEPDPDIFNFNVNGISGKFFMGNDGIIRVVTNSPNNIKVDLSQLAFQEDISPTQCKPKPSKIILTDNAGNKYHFGGELKNLEYSNSVGNTFMSNHRPVINSWFLSKIEYYNGSVVNFNYRDDSVLPDYFADENLSIHDFRAYDTANPSLPNKKDFVVLTESISKDLSYGTDPNAGIAVGPNDPVYSIQKIAILESITSDNFKLTFDYTRQPHVFNNRNTPTDYIPTNFINRSYNLFLDIKLDKITLFNSTNNQIKKFDLLYDHFGGSLNSRMFLKSITEEGKTPHAFEYYPTGNLPKPITYAIDHWGYWNGHNDNTNELIPWVNYDMLTGDYTFENNAGGMSRNPDFNFALKGQLKKVIYPTRGFTEFEYEAHFYSKRLETRSIDGFLPGLHPVNDIAGGTRIKKISDFDGTTYSNIKEYKYVTDYANNGSGSSGILFKWPRYHLYYQAEAITSAPLIFFFRRSNPIGNIIENSPVIAYSEVTEVVNGNGFKVNKYSDFISHPDLLDYKMLTNSFPGPCRPMGLAINYIGNLLNDRAQERGKVIMEKIYDNSSNLKMETSFVYNNNPNKFNSFTTRMHISGPVTITNKIYFYNDFLTEKNTTIFTPTGNSITTEKSVYTSVPNYSTLISNQDVLSKASVTTSAANELLETEYKYPWDIYTTGSTDYINFKDANLYMPLRVTQYRNSSKLSESFSVLAKDATTNNKLMLKNSYSSKFPNANPVIANGVGQLEKKSTYDFYDSMGNITQFTTEGGTSTSIIWGYNKSEPIAKIENATLAQVAAALGTSVATLQTYNESNMTALNGLRSSLPNAMVTTYTHLPLVGVSTITDPKGDIITYTYDSVGRLQNANDKNGNLLSQYKYHYKNQ